MKKENEIKEKINEATETVINMHNDSLLFRIYDKKEKLLYYPEFSELGVTFGPSPDGKHYPRNASDFLFDICAWDGTRYIAEKSTGLRDAVGRLIYENDEFECDSHRWRVVYIERNASFFCLNLDTDKVAAMNDSDININNIIICGNIHDI